jgi:dipeptidyl aminopeptidase/acylaminoacyl peptidase
MLTFSDPRDFPGEPELADVGIRPAAGISWYGPSDFTQSLKQESGNSVRNRHLRNITGKQTYSDSDFETLRDVSPYFLVDSSDPPLLLQQGDSDHAVHLSHATHLDARAKEVGSIVELVIVENAGHNWRQVDGPIDPTKAEIRDLMLEFAQKTVNIR